MKKNSSEKIPSFQFYPSDWLGDMNLRMCSVSTRGVWIDLLCLMHKSKKYGYLVHKVDGKLVNMNPKTIQKLTGMTTKRIIIGIQELSKNDVLKRDSDNLIYSKRMVKDHALRLMRKEVGKLGGNPDLVNQDDNQTGNQKPTPSSSSSSSSSKKEDTPPISPQENDQEVEVLNNFNIFYQEYPNKKSKVEAEKAWNQVFEDKKSKFYFKPITKKLFELILFAIKEQIEEKREKVVAKQFCPPWPYPATWIRAKRWDDRVEQIPKTESPTARRVRESKGDRYEGD